MIKKKVSKKKEEKPMIKKMRITALAATMPLIFVTACGGLPGPGENDVESLQSEIIGGKPVDISNYPYQVALLFTHDSSQFCGGSIIDERWVVTAAHCTVGLRPSELAVLAGVSKLSEGNTKGQRVGVSKIIIHPRYDDDTTRNDISLVYLRMPLILGSNGVDKVQLATTNSQSEFYADFNLGLTAPGKAVTVSGWGSMEPDGNNASDYPDQLRAATVRVVDHELAEKWIGEDVPKTQLAAGFRIGGTDSCYGDSGGPLVARVSNKPVLVGVVSWGMGCAQKKSPGFYTRVSSYRPWMSTQMAGE